MKNKKTFLFLFFITLFVVGLDFLVKNYVSAHIPLLSWASPFYPYGGIPVFQNWLGIDFSINHAVNKGAAWGMFSSWQSILLYARVAIIGGIIVYLFTSPQAPSKRVPLILVVAGAMGNVLDYFLYGHVIDMFHFKFGSYTYPIFNIADSAIFCGIVWLLLQSFKSKPRENVSAP